MARSYEYRAVVGGERSAQLGVAFGPLLYVEAVDRPKLLLDLVKIITDINISVESGEFDTEGLLAKAKFHVSYKDKAISKPLQKVLMNPTQG
ncbi:hypothetical protein QJS10_CPB19g01188 [Acorus calamus]|uniref:ACT domain-containing protein ACR n=1 Tax=Acorus calamus TaxID=4465 RepID=A0AAV9CJU2_ACOCL|nr:hypothetical protein QJS10_CPB19g01188 [Acorus calamus]